MGSRKNAKTPVDLGPLPELIGYVLRRAQLAVFQDFFAAFAPFDIRPAQFSVLTVIERNPGLTQSQAAEALGIKRTNFVGMLDELETRGLAARRQTAGRVSCSTAITTCSRSIRSICGSRRRSSRASTSCPTGARSSSAAAHATIKAS